MSFNVCLQVDRNRELLRKFEEQTLQQKEMTREVLDTRTQLQHTQQGQFIVMIHNTLNKVSSV